MKNWILQWTKNILCLYVCHVEDAHLKLHKYRDAGVREYWLVDLEKERVVVYFFEQDELPTIYGADMEIPVGIFGGELKLIMADMFDLLREIK